MKTALVELDKLRTRAAQVTAAGGRAYNPGWHLALDLRNMLVVAECVAQAALERQESRGGHTRDDYPGMSPEWRKVNLICSLDADGTVALRRQPMVPPLIITPMRAFPVIRDLVTDVSFNYAKAREIPSFTPSPSVQPGEFRMQQVDVNRSQEFRKCIECFLCQNTCHVIRDHTENDGAFAGPRFLMRVAELEMHPADTADRREIAQDDFGLGYCNITKCCTEVCPEHIKITDNALIPMKERVVGRKYDPLV